MKTIQELFNKWGEASCVKINEYSGDIRGDTYNLLIEADEFINTQKTMHNYYNLTLPPSIVERAEFYISNDEILEESTNVTHQVKQIINNYKY